jgi:hypothetical protein
MTADVRASYGWGCGIVGLGPWSNSDAVAQCCRTTDPVGGCDLLRVLSKRGCDVGAN